MKRGWAIGAALLFAASAAADDLLVASLHGDEVLRYDGTTGAFMGVFASTHMDGPQSVVVGPDGNVYVGSEYTGNVTKWSPAGDYLGDFVSGLPGPSQIQFGPDGNLYVLNHIDGEPAPVMKFDGASGAFLGMVAPGAGPGHHHGLAFRDDGHLFVGKVGALEIRHSGALGVGDLGVFAGGPEIAIAAHLEFGPDGHLYVSNPLDSGFLVGGVIRYDGLTGAPMGAFSTVGLPEPTWGMTWHDSHMYYTAGGAVVRVDATTGGLASLFVTPGSGGLTVGTGIAFVESVPEPGTLAALGIGLAALVKRRRSRKF